MNGVALRRLWREVKRFLVEELELLIPERVQASLASFGDLNGARKYLVSKAYNRGMCCAVERSPKPVDGDVSVVVLHDLSRELTASLLLHEAVHAWLKLNPEYANNRRWTKSWEEGFCQLASFIWLDQKKQGLEMTEKKVVEHYQWQIENHPDPTYKLGFEQAQRVYDNAGSFKEALRSLCK